MSIDLDSEYSGGVVGAEDCLSVLIENKKRRTFLREQECDSGDVRGEGGLAFIFLWRHSLYKKGGQLYKKGGGCSDRQVLVPGQAHHWLVFNSLPLIVRWHSKPVSLLPIPTLHLPSEKSYQPHS